MRTCTRRAWLLSSSRCASVTASCVGRTSSLSMGITAPTSQGHRSRSTSCAARNSLSTSVCLIASKRLMMANSN
uniref:Putative secreted protein n=1 Tax=Ixodes ricinus TaxID=34613 RepID=A0A6B0UAQ4_IXORI